MMSEQESDLIATIARWTELLRIELTLVSAHRKLLEQENPAALPLQDAIIEKALRDTGLPTTMALIERILQLDDLSPEVISAPTRLEQEFKDAAASLSSGAPDQRVQRIPL
jgi:hypothetical protein